MQKKQIFFMTILFSIFFALYLYSQPGRKQGRGPGGRQPRKHTNIQSQGLSRLVPATQKQQASKVKIYIKNNLRIIEANGIPQHLTGRFPNRGNPHSIEAQNYAYSIPANPQKAIELTKLGMHNFGIAVNGVPFDPGAAEWYQGIRGSKWQYEALSGAVPLGVDENHAHVQPTGAYHYHGLPTKLIEGISLDDIKHSPIIGWAADGFPIYALYGYRDGKSQQSGIKKLTSSYQLKSGDRPNGSEDPGGKYDGTFLEDYIFVEGSGDLDECNGRDTITPEFPHGTYAYFLTEAWPVIPRVYRGTPSKDFLRQQQHGRRPR